MTPDGPGEAIMLNRYLDSLTTYAGSVADERIVMEAEDVVESFRNQSLQDDLESPVGTPRATESEDIEHKSSSSPSRVPASQDHSDSPRNSDQSTNTGFRNIESKSHDESLKGQDPVEIPDSTQPRPENHGRSGGKGHVREPKVPSVPESIYKRPPKWRVRLNQQTVWGGAFLLDMKSGRFMTISEREGVMQSYDLQTGAMIDPTKHPVPIRIPANSSWKLCRNNNGTTILVPNKSGSTIGYSHAVIMNTALSNSHGSVLRLPRGRLEDSVISPDGKYIALLLRTRSVTNFVNTSLRVVLLHVQTGQQTEVCASAVRIRFHTIEFILACGHEDGTITLRDLSFPGSDLTVVIVSKGYDYGYGLRLGFSSDGSLLFVRIWRNEVHFVDLSGLPNALQMAQ